MSHRRQTKYRSRLSKKEISWFIEDKENKRSRLSKKEISWFIEEKHNNAVDFLKKIKFGS